MDKKQKRTCVEDSISIGHPEFHTETPSLHAHRHPSIKCHLHISNRVCMQKWPVSAESDAEEETQVGLISKVIISISEGGINPVVTEVRESQS